jgi:hypothetical protein
MPLESSDSSSSSRRGEMAEPLLQEELQDLRSLVVHADHLRWVTRGARTSGFDAIVSRFIGDWREWSERAARSLVDLGIPPDGRVSSLTDGSYRAWLPDGWVEGADAESWMFHELGVLAEWARVRKELATPAEFTEFFEAVEAGSPKSAPRCRLGVRAARPPPVRRSFPGRPRWTRASPN